MKRKLFSAILFGALLTASTSGLTSCKDYDDDISNLQSQIDKLATKEELQQKANELSSSISAAQSAAESAKKTAEDAAAAAKTATTGAEAAQKAADAAQAAADKAQKAADAAQAAADKNAEDLKKAAEGATKAVEEIQTAMKGLATTEAVNAAVKEVDDKYDAQAKDLKTLSDRLAKVEAKLGLGEGGEDIDLTEIQAELEDIEDAFEALVGVVSDMVTSVELVYNSQDYKYNAATTPSGTPAACPNDLSFTIVTEKKNDSFGKDKADKILTTTKNQTSFYNDEIYVRVNPVDAVLTKEDISLINSKGEELTGIVDVIDVQPYKTDAYITRAANQRTGLWAVKVAPAAGKKVADLWSKFATDNFDPRNPYTAAKNKIVYAVAVKSAISDSIASNRRIVSAYDVTMKVTSYTATVSDITDHASGETNTIRVKTSATVDGSDARLGKNIKEIHNRFKNTATYGYKDELVWKTPSSPETGYVYDANDPGAATNTAVQGDRRYGVTNNVIARVGEDIKIKFSKDIKGFYVMLDYDFVETTSQPSEINAWNSYKYENVGKTGVAAKMFESNEGSIKVSALSGEATGDEIGFRIFAMNLDGSLVDPDGIAFYVTVGETGDNAVLDSQNVTVVKDLSTVTPAADKGNITSALALPQNFLSYNALGTNQITGVKWSVSKGSDNSQPSSTSYAVYYNTGSNGALKSGTNAWQNASKVAIQFVDPKQFVDGETYTFTGEVTKQQNGTTYTVKTITVQVKKVMPTTPPLFVFNVEQAPEQVILPGDALDDLKLSSDGSAKEGKLDFNNMFIKSNNKAIKDDPNYIFSLASSWEKTNADGSKSDVARVRAWNKDVNANLADALGYKTTIAAKYIDCRTPHALTSSYNYGTITSNKNDDGSWANWVRETNSYSLTYYTWSYIGTGYMNYEWLKTADKDNSGKPTGTYTTHNTVTIESGTNTTTTFDLKNVAAKPGAKINTGIRKSDLDAYLADKWLVVDKITVEAKNAAGNVITNPYYTASASGSTAGTWKITFTRKNDIANVPAHEGTLKITVKDCYQKKSTIVLEGIKFVQQ